MLCRGKVGGVGDTTGYFFYTNNTSIWSHRTENSASPAVSARLRDEVRDDIQGAIMREQIAENCCVATRLNVPVLRACGCQARQLRILHSLNEVCILLRQLGGVLNQNADALDGIILRRR